jgi:hypothetical protein
VISAMLEATRRAHEAAPAAVPAAAPVASAPSNATAAAPAAAPFAASPMAGDPRFLAAQARLQSMGYNIGGMPTAMGGSSFTPRVFRVDAAERSELAASSAQRATPDFKNGGPSESAALLRTLAGQALRFAAIGTGPAGMAAVSGLSMFGRMMPGMHPSAPTITYAWGLPGAHSSRDLNTGTPSFELRYADIPGIDPDAYEPALLHLVLTKDNYRLLGATRQTMARMDASGGAEWIAEERVPAVVVKKQERGVYTLVVTQALAAGEYALALRPAKHYSAHPSGFGNGQLLNAMVWDFSAMPAAAAAPASKR